ncbi:hypothetical protein Scep_008218 [Stephania cephalantha]|uniref:Glycosyltransferase subfamily 4-like N-terminal domain-containing protein n=1 Tax=Stephania cephalantha TaxID=152367 RepID=A0AAP0KB83_9MAGN
MAKDQSSSSSSTSRRCFCYALTVFSTLSSLSLFLGWSHRFDLTLINQQQYLSHFQQHGIIRLPSYSHAWNRLSFSSAPPPNLLKIAVFVKKWPHPNQAGGLERHAFTLHLALANRGHQLHIFTTTSQNSSSFQTAVTTHHPNMHFHLSPPSPAGYLQQSLAWDQFQAQNSTGNKPFDIVHTESVGLMYTRARNLTNLAVSWHGIAYETIHSDIIQDLLRSPQDPRSKALTERLIKVVEEVKFFQNYAHHVATSDHVGDVLKRIYMIPEERVHVILNGVDEHTFRPNLTERNNFRSKFSIPESGSLVLGLAGRLVKDKGHPLMFEALKQITLEDEMFRKNVFVVVAGDGPWSDRYRNISANVLVMGPLEPTQMAVFYNAIDVFVNPTLRAQGLDHTLLEAILSGKPVMATRLASITSSIIVSSEMGYTFSPMVDSLKKALRRVWDDRGDLEKKGEMARQRALKLFTATKMAAAYERLFLCISNHNRDNKDDYCRHSSPALT